jgi:S-layer protein
MLTTGVDAFAGTAGNDVANATLGTTATLNAFDNINGGAGDDTLNISSTGSTVAFAMPASTTIAGFENVNVSNAGTAAGTNAATITNTTFGTGVKKLSYTESGAGTTDAVAVTLNSATDVSVVSNGVTFTTVAVTDTSAVVASTGSTLKNITLTKVNGAQTLTGNGITSLTLNDQQTAVATVTAAAGTRELTVNTAGTSNITGVTDATATTLSIKNTGIQTLGTYTAAKATTVNVDTTAAATGLIVTAATATKLNVTGTNTVAAVITGSTALTDINISGAGAGLTSVVDLSGIATGLANITSTATTVGSGATAVGKVTLGATTVTAGFGNAVTFTGGAGDDTISVGATTKTIDVGAGNNKVYMVAGTTALGAGGKITATAGTTDTLFLANADAATLTTSKATIGAAFKAAVTGFETLNVTAAASTISMVDGGDFSTLAVTTAGVTQVVNNWSTGKTVELTVGAAAMTDLQLSTMTGSADTVTVKLKDDLSAGVKAYGTVTTAGAETVTITTVDSNTTHAATLATLTVVDTVASSIIVNGNNGVALVAASTAITNFDASGLTKGAVTFTSGILPTDVTVKGSVAGGDTLDFKAATAIVTMTATAGTNTLLGSATVGSTITGGSGNDTITGGSGADTITVGAGGTANSVTGAAGKDSITLTGATGVDTVKYGAANTASAAAGANMDTITGFVTGSDKIDLSVFAVTAASSTLGFAGANTTTAATMNAKVTSATSVATLADVYTQLAVDLLNANNAFAASATGANGIVARVVEYSNGAAAGTYLVVNDANISFQAATDVVIKLVGGTSVAAGDFSYTYNAG